MDTAIAPASDLTHSLDSHPLQRSSNGHADGFASADAGPHPQHQQNVLTRHQQEMFASSPGSGQHAFSSLASNAIPNGNIGGTNGGNNPSSGLSPLEMLSDAAAAPARHSEREARSPSVELGAEIGVGDSDPLRIIFNKRFDTFESAHEAAEEMARQSGFALSIRSKRPTAENFNRAVLACSQGGKYRASHTATPDKRRQTSTLKTGCPYKVAIKRNKLNKWFVEAVQGSNRDRHNHVSLSTGAFSRYRHRLVESVKDSVVEMSRRGLKASVIREMLVDSRPEYSAITIHDVRNAMKRYEKEILRDGQTWKNEEGGDGGGNLESRKWTSASLSPIKAGQGAPDISGLENTGPGEGHLQEHHHHHHHQGHEDQTQIDSLDQTIQSHVPPTTHINVVSHMVPHLPSHSHLDQMDHQIGQIEQMGDDEESSLHAAAAAAAHFDPHAQHIHHLHHHHHHHHHDGVQGQHDELQQHYHSQVDGNESGHALPLNIPIDPAVTQGRAEEASM